MVDSSIRFTSAFQLSFEIEIITFLKPTSVWLYLKMFRFLEFPSMLSHYLNFIVQLKRCNCWLCSYEFEMLDWIKHRKTMNSLHTWSVLGSWASRIAWTSAAVASASTLRFLKHVADEQSLKSWNAWSEISQSNPNIEATSIIWR